MRPTITIDIGTTSIKLCRFDADGRLAGSGRFPTPTTTDEHGEVYDAAALWGGITRFIGEQDAAAKASVASISITGVGESGGLVRGDLSLASPLILWHDQRGASRLAALSPQQRSRLYRITGLPASANYGLSKVAWALDRSDAPGDALWLNVAEYLAAVMTGQRWSEPSLASRTLALDLTARQWSEEAAGMLGVDTRVFPALRAASAETPITAAFAAETGLSPSVLVHVAGHDHMVGGVGAGLEPGELLNSTGTTEGLLFVSDAPHLGTDAENAKLANGLGCDASRSDAGYTLFASIPTGGSAFATLQRMLGLTADRLSDLVGHLHEQYIGGSLSLDRVPVVVPQFRGSPPPTKNASARGAIAGIDSDTTAEEIVFGTFLGLVLEFRDVLSLFPLAPSRLKVIGPGSGNPLWLQLKADLLGAALSASQFPEVVSRGAQGLASGVRGRWEDNDPQAIDPDEDRHRLLTDWAESVRAQRAHLSAVPR